MRLFFFVMPFFMSISMGALAAVMLGLEVSGRIQGLAPLALLPGCFAFVFLLVGVFVTRFVRRREEAQDQAMLQLGPGAPLGFPSRQWHGTIDGRRVDAFFQRGPSFDVNLEVRAGWRMSVGQDKTIGRAIARGLGRSPISVDDPAFEGRVVYAKEPERARSLIAAVKEPILALTEATQHHELAQLHVQPECVVWRLHRTQSVVPRERVTAGLAALSDIARAIEDQPPGDATATPLEHMSRVDRSRLYRRVLLVVLAILAVVAGLITGLMMLVVMQLN